MEAEAESEPARPARQATRTEGQPSIEDVFDTQGAALGVGFALGAGTRVPPRWAGRRRQPPPLHALNARPRARRGATAVSGTVEQRGTDFAERWRVEEQHRLARADAEADRELARLPASEEADEVEARLRREVARGKRGRVEAAPYPALRARTGPPLPPLTGLLEAREQGRGEKCGRGLWASTVSTTTPTRRGRIPSAAKTWTARVEGAPGFEPPLRLILSTSTL